MKLSVYFTPLGVKQDEIAGKPVVVIDVIRATTTIVTALANGAKAIVPAKNSEDAVRIANNLKRDDVILAGERNADRIPGFDLGNSPLEMTPEAVAGKTIVMATTNGSEALLVSEPGGKVMIGAVVNFSATAESAREAFDQQGELILLCAARERTFALEDAYVAGRLAQSVLSGRGRNPAELNDGAIAARELVRRYGDRWKSALSASGAARELKRAGFADDIVAATEADKYSIVPLYSDRLVTLPSQG